MIARFDRDAAREAIDAAAYYNSEREGLGDDFREEVQSGVARILESPLTWPLQYKDVRRYRLNRVPDGIYYRIRDDAIEVVAVMHLHRKPLYWRHRLKPK